MTPVKLTVCHRPARQQVYVSYGGLLMKIVGDQRALSALELDSMVYCLIKRTDKD